MDKESDTGTRDKEKKEVLKLRSLEDGKGERISNDKYQRSK